MRVYPNTNPKLKHPLIVSFVGPEGQRRRLGCDSELEGEVMALQLAGKEDDRDYASCHAAVVWFLKTLEETTVKRSRIEAANRLKPFVKLMDEVRLRDVTVKDVRAFRSEVADQGHSPNHVTNICAVVLTLFYKLHLEGFIDQNPAVLAFSTLPSYYPPREVRFPALEEADALREVADLRELVVLDLIYEAALRDEEVTGLKWPDYVRGSGTRPRILKIRRVKTQHDAGPREPGRQNRLREIEVSDRLATTLDAWYAERKSASDYVISGSSAEGSASSSTVPKIIRRLQRRIGLWREDEDGELQEGVSKYTPLEFRHARAILWHGKYSTVEHARQLGITVKTLLKLYSEFFVEDTDHAQIERAALGLFGPSGGLFEPDADNL